MSRYDIYTLSDAATLHFQLNHNSPPMDDPRVRKALSLALDRQEYTEFFGRGRWEIATPMSERSNSYALAVSEVTEFPGFRQLDRKKHPDDIDEAARLLNDAGYTDENPLKFTLLTANVIQSPKLLRSPKGTGKNVCPLRSPWSWLIPRPRWTECCPINLMWRPSGLDRPSLTRTTISVWYIWETGAGISRIGVIQRLKNCSSSNRVSRTMRRDARSLTKCRGWS